MKPLKHQKKLHEYTFYPHNILHWFAGNYQNILTIEEV